MTYRYLRFRPALIAGCILSAVISYNTFSGQENTRQDSQLPARISDQTYRVSVDLVNVLCSVYDKNTNSFVTNLMQGDFTIYEDNQRQEIKNFARETDLPLTISDADRHEPECSAEAEI